MVPEILVQRVIDRAREDYEVSLETTVVAEETVIFKIPKVLQRS